MAVHAAASLLAGVSLLAIGRTPARAPEPSTTRSEQPDTLAPTVEAT